MSFNVSYIANKEVATKNDKLNEKMDKLIRTNEDLLRGFSVDALPLTQSSLSIGSLRALYPLQETLGNTAYDYSGNGNNAVIERPLILGATGTSEIPHLVDFKGGYITANGCSVKGLSEFSFTAIVELNSKQTQNIWFEPTADNRTKARFQIVWNNTSRNIIVYVRTGNAASTPVSATTTDTISDGLCALHISVDCEQGTIDIYRNGLLLTLASPVTFTSPAIEGTEPHNGPFIGRTAAIAGEPTNFKSRLAFVGIYEKALTASEVEQNTLYAGF